MKKRAILISLVGLLMYVSFSSYKYGYGTASSGGLLNGAVGTAGCTSGSCHSSSSSISVTVQLLNGTTPVTTYVPGATYKLKITGTNGTSSTLPYFGFQACVVKASGAGSTSAVGVGTLGSPPSTNTHVFTASSGSGIQVFEHYNASFGDGSINSGAGGGSGTVYMDSINWTAPVAGTGNVVLYGILNAVNHDGSSSGDFYNSASPVTIFEQVAPITGTTSVCLGGTTTLTDATPGGSWSTTGGTGSVSLAASGTSVTVTGVTAGTATINYNAGSSGTASTTVTVIAAPSPITGTFTVCSGSTTTLSDATPSGSWSTTAGTGSVTLSPSGSSVTVTGVTAGTAQVTYTAASTGCSVAATVTVNATPAAGTISGPSSFCIGVPATLTGSPGGGTWVANTAGGFATIGATTGVVTGSSVGLVSISYALTSSGCTSFGTRIVTVNAAVAAISGTTTMCQGGTTTLTDASLGGTWSTVAGTGSVTLAASGTTVTVTGASAGTATVNYTLTTGCAASVTVTVNPLPAGIAGLTEVCLGSSTTLSDITSGGVWTSGSPSIASVGSLTGSVTGASVGTATISYTLPATGCFVTQSMTVDPLPTSITGPSTVCVGASVAESSTPGGGTWSSSLSSLGSVDASGNVTGVSPGTITITYAVGTGCQVTKQMTINAAPAVSPISGTLFTCIGSSVTLTDATLSGTWTSSNPSIATIGSTSGIVNGVAAGTTVISYAFTGGSGCTGYATANLTVNPNPSPISGSGFLCVGANTTLSDPSGSGTWSSSNTSIATVGSTTGIVSGTGPGVSTITFTLLSTGCSVSMGVTVNPSVAPISGPNVVCAGDSITLTDITLGGAWSGSPTTVAIISSTTGKIIGVSPGVFTVTYASGGSCSRSHSVTVNAIPAAISGPSQVCVNSTITQTDVTPGGTWSSSTPSLGSINSGGVVTGVSAGNPVITYTLPATGCFNAKRITVNPLPAASAGSNVSICTGGSTTLTASGGGTYSWTPGTGLSCSTCSSPVATPVATTTYTVTVTLPTGCFAKSTVTVSVNPLPAAITGLSAVCEGATVTLTDATAGGTWSSGAVGTATVASAGTTGTVTGVAAGVAVISYTLGTGCFVTKNVSVNAAPTAISGASSVCVGLTTTLTDGVAGGTWTSSNLARATVGSVTGVVTGVSAGSVNITYTLAGGCLAVTTITVNPLSPVTGLSSLCAGSSTTLANATAGGTWSSSNTAVGTISSTGVFSALSPGNTTITYSLPTGCAATLTVTVISAPAPIAGSNRVCIGFTTTLTDPGGGAWSSSAPGIASVGSASGVVTGVTAGVATISYSLGTGCTATMPVTVNTNPVAIAGPSVVCELSTITLTDATSGGTWSSSNANATVGSTGVVTGVAGGTSVISYTMTTGCFAVKPVTVNPLPAVIGGTTAVCQGSTSSLTDATSGGTWSSSNTAVGTISTAGLFNALTTGTTTISYVAVGCTRTTVVTVNPLPAAITGVASVCAGSTTTLSDATGGGVWSCSPTTIASIGSATGTVTGVAAGVASVVYTLPTGCSKSVLVTVNAVPVVAAISGSSTICTGTTITLTDATPGGVWASSASGIASVSSTGVVSGVAIGTANITYSVTGTGGCVSFVTFPVTVNGSPAPVTGTLSVCAGLSTTLSDATGGGTWTSAAPGTASIGSSTGVVNGIAAGTSVVTYTIGNGCIATAVVTVNPLPAAIAGPSVVCVGAAITLTDAGGGTWASSDVTVATVGSSSGIVTGVSAGAVTITYALPTGCTAITAITVNPLANAGTITGPTSVCEGVTITLADAAPGGVWSSSNANATVGSTGVVTGVTAGTATISYTVTNSCGPVSAVYPVTINPAPVAGTISGTATVCVGANVTLTDAASGGSWSSATPSVATVGSASGIVTGVAAGTALISYTVTNICGTISATYNVTVSGPPSAGTITGADSVCQGDTVHLHNLVTGGTWSSVLGNATVDATGLVTGVNGGIDTIKYTVTGTCGTTVATFVMHIRLHTDCNVGVQPVPAALTGISIYPNPSNGTFTVEIPELRNQASIEVSDVLGKTIEHRVLTTAGKSVLELRNAPAGTYLVKVNMDGGSFRQKIVIW